MWGGVWRISSEIYFREITTGQPDQASICTGQKGGKERPEHRKNRRRNTS